MLLPLLVIPFKNSHFNKIDKRVKTKIRTLTRESISVIVETTNKGFNDSLEYIMQKRNAKVKYKLPIINSYAIEIPAHSIENIAKIKNVRYICDDSKIFSQLNIARKQTGAEIVNKTGYTGKNIGIAILDTGVFPHPDLTKPKNRIIAFKDFVNKHTSPYDDNGHGTHVAGSAAGNGYSSNGKYIGAAPDANIISVKVMDKNGTGNTSDIVAGIQWVLDNSKKYNIKIMSLSLGSKAEQPLRIDPLVRAVNKAWEKGIVVVAAAGNSGPKKGTITTPGISPTIITIGASDNKGTSDIKDDTIANFSSRGPIYKNIIKPDLVAPGVNVISLNSNKSYTPNKATNKYTDVLPTDLYRKATGTSVSTPIVSGSIALILEKFPDISPDKVKKLIKENTINLNAKLYEQGKGLLNISFLAK